MEIKYIAFGIAKEILDGASGTVTLEAKSADVGMVRDHLTGQYPEFHRLASVKFAVNTEYVEDSHQLMEGDELVIIPPVSGG